MGGPALDSALCVQLRRVLDSYPALAASLSKKYPDGIATVERMNKFEADRKKESGHWHLLNLPFVLYMAGLDENADGRDLALSLLQTLDSFCEQLGSVPGFDGVLKPLRDSEGLWKGDDPKFWSVVASAQTSLLLRSKKFTLKEFAKKLPAETNKDADIFVESPEGHGIYLDLVMKHRPKFTTVEEARAELSLHADDKIGSKFGPVMKTQLPVMVLVVVVARQLQLQILLKNPDLLKTIVGTELDRRDGIAACFHAVVGNRGPDGRLSWHLAALEELGAARPATDSETVSDAIA
jgi:hypothetical protein